MADVGSKDVTQLLLHWGSGDSSALERLVPIIYGELHRLAHRHMAREQPGRAFETTELIHEVYLRLVDVKRMGFANRAHFFAACSQIMRRILIDLSRSDSRRKRGGGARTLDLDAAATIASSGDTEFVALDDALTALSKVDARKARVVEMKFYGGLTAAEIASVLQVSPDTVQRDWQMAKVWLLREMDRRGEDVSRRTAGTD